MKRLLLLLLPLITAGGLAFADNSPADATAAKRLSQFRRDRHLLRKLVEGAVRLAAEDDPLKRANYCSDLAEGLAQEAQKAVLAKDSVRANVLGGHLQGLLVRGVAENLNRARGLLPPNSPRLPEMRRVGERGDAVMLPLQEELDRMSEKEEAMQPLLDAVNTGRAAVKRAAEGNETPRTKGTKAPPAGKKLKK
ncbi:MAG TPA: hypothetical protein VEL76_11365 [Gemmataceae bacterium]|nr:hypothetical protein [Gemmataceae bacterium]